RERRQPGPCRFAADFDVDLPLTSFRTDSMNRFNMTARGLAWVLVSSLVLSRAQTVRAERPSSQEPPDEAARTRSVAPSEIPPPPPDEPGRGGESIKDYIYSTDQAIELYTGRVGKNPRDYISYRVLGELYIRRASSEGGGLADFARAETACRQSLAINQE